MKMDMPKNIISMSVQNWTNTDYINITITKLDEGP